MPFATRVDALAVEGGEHDPMLSLLADENLDGQVLYLPL
jgi:hypothetical protein